MHSPSWRPLGDPAKVAQVILQVAAMDDPPARLLLGSEAYAYATAAARAQLASDEQWRDLSRSTDRDDATARGTRPARDPPRRRGVTLPGPACAGKRAVRLLRVRLPARHARIGQTERSQ